MVQPTFSRSLEPTRLSPRLTKTSIYRFICSPAPLRVNPGFPPGGRQSRRGTLRSGCISTICLPLLSRLLLSGIWRHGTVEREEKRGAPYQESTSPLSEFSGGEHANRSSAGGWSPANEKRAWRWPMGSYGSSCSRKLDAIHPSHGRPMSAASSLAPHS